MNTEINKLQHVLAIFLMLSVHGIISNNISITIVTLLLIHLYQWNKTAFEISKLHHKLIIFIVSFNYIHASMKEGNIHCILFMYECNIICFLG